MTATIWDTTANAGAGGIATRTTIVGWTEPEGEDAPQPIYGDPVPLERLSGAKWTRPRWAAELWADPAAHGASNFLPGERILDDVMVPPSIPEGKKRGPDLDVPAVDLEAGTAVWWTLVDKDSGDLAADLAARKAAISAAITARRWEVETGGITLNGAAIATDPTSQAKLSGALQLVQSDDTRIIDWKGVNGWIILDAADVTAIAVSVGGHVQACFTREKEMLAAVTAAETTAALALIDVQAGTIDGAGGWPT